MRKHKGLMVISILVFAFLLQKSLLFFTDCGILTMKISNSSSHLPAFQSQYNMNYRSAKERNDFLC